MHDTDHPDDDALLEYAVGVGLEDLRGLEATQAHVRSCRKCTDRLAELRQSDRSKPSAGRLREAAAFEKVMREESAAAPAVIADVLAGPSAWWRTRVFNEPAALTCGFATALAERAVELLDTSPAEALEATTLAVDVAERLRVDAYPHDLVISVRANAWREHAYTLFYIGRLNDAAGALDVAEQLFRQTPLPHHDLARTSLIRAALLVARDAVGEAIPLAEEAGDVFARFGDRARYVKARMTEGTLRYRANDIHGALAIWLELEKDEDLRRSRDFGLLLHNIGHAYRDLSGFAEAQTYLQRAVAEYEHHGADVEKVRTRWVIGQTLVLAGDVPRGLPMLRTAWREFEDLGMQLEAALVGLEMAEALLIAGDTETVAKICRTILDRFVQERMMSRAIAALAYLREAVATGKATPAIVRDVREFLQALPQSPGRAFAPPSV